MRRVTRRLEEAEELSHFSFADTARAEEIMRAIMLHSAELHLRINELPDTEEGRRQRERILNELRVREEHFSAQAESSSSSGSSAPTKVREIVETVRTHREAMDLDLSVRMRGVERTFENRVRSAQSQSRAMQEAAASSVQAILQDLRKNDGRPSPRSIRSEALISSRERGSEATDARQEPEDGEGPGDAGKAMRDRLDAIGKEIGRASSAASADGQHGDDALPESLPEDIDTTDPLIP